MLRYCVERLPDLPHARHTVRIDVIKHAQDAQTVIRAGRERIHVKPPVVFLGRCFASVGFDRPKARETANQVPSVCRTQRRYELLSARSESRHHGGQSLAIFTLRGRMIDAAGARIVAHIFSAACKRSRRQERSFVSVEGKREPRKEQYAAGFEVTRSNGRCSRVERIVPVRNR